jgi:hypothetical protein
MTGADGREHVLESVLAQTGQPVLAAIVLASDGAQLIGYSPRAGRWSGWLTLEVLVDYLDSQYTECLNVDDDEELPADLDEFWQSRYREACRPLYALAPPASIAAPRAVAWAVEAGYAPSVEAVEAILDRGEAFAEDQFFKPLAALGLPALTGAGTEPGWRVVVEIRPRLSSCQKGTDDGVPGAASGHVALSTMRRRPGLSVLRFRQAMYRRIMLACSSSVPSRVNYRSAANWEMRFNHDEFVGV